MNRLDGKTTIQKVVTEKPVLGLLHTSKLVHTAHTTMVDLTSGKILGGADAKVMHGLPK